MYTVLLCTGLSLDVVRLGAHNLALETEAAADDYRVRSASLHPEYDDTGVIPINDIAILALDTPESGVREKPEVSPVCLPGPGEVSTLTPGPCNHKLNVELLASLTL